MDATRQQDAVTGSNESVSVAVFQAGFESSPVGTVIVDATGKIVRVNRQLEHMLDYQREQLLGQPIEILVPDSLRHKHRIWRKDYMRSPVTRMMSQRADIRARRQDGSEVPVEIGLSVCTVGAQTYVIAAVNDVSERKEVENRIRESEQRFHRAIQGSAVGIWEWDIATGCVTYSDRFKELLGYEPQEFSNDLSTWIEHIHPEDTYLAKETLQRHLRVQKPFDIECRMRTRTGPYRWFRVCGRLQRNMAGKLDRMSGSIADVTDRRQAQDDLRASNAQLAAVHRALVGFLRCHNPSESMEQLLNDLMTLTGSDFGFIDEVHADAFPPRPLCRHVVIDRSGPSDAIQHRLLTDRIDALQDEVMRTGCPATANNLSGETGESDARPPEAKLPHLLVLPLRHGHRLLGLVGIARHAEWFSRRTGDQLRPHLAACASLIMAAQLDAQRRDAVRELAAARQRAEAANRAQSEILSNTVQEFRPPLNSILESTRRLTHQMALKESEETRNTLADIDRTTRDLLDRISHIRPK